MKLVLLLPWLFLGNLSQLELEITGIDQIAGFIMIAVYDSKEDFLTDRVVASGQHEVKGEIVRANLTLPFGRYAISVYHDINADGELNTKIFGIPKEPVGFSNNARGNFGPPEFKDVIVDFEIAGQTVAIELY